MRQAKIPVIVVGGPTASGKSSLALALAIQWRGEIVNCDSLQLYRGMDVGTAKPTKADRALVPHHLFDILEPAEIFNAGDYAELARGCISEIHGRGRVPIMVGGTGFYLRATLEGLAEGPGRNEVLRARLAEAEARKQGFLTRLLRRLDPAVAARIHGNDKHKLVRAVEICLLSREPASEVFAKGRDPFHEAAVLKLVLDPPREELKVRIAGRTKAMFAGGLLDELRELLQAGVPEDAKAFESIGYCQARDVIAGRTTVEQAVELVTVATRQYAKRQLTWFRRESGVHWLAGFGEDAHVQQEALQAVREFIAQFTDRTREQG